MEFDWLDCPDLTWTDAVGWPTIDTDDLSVASFNTGHKPNGKVTANDDSLAMAQATVVGMVDPEVAPPLASTAAQRSSKLVPVDINANDLASMVATVYNASKSSSTSLLDSSDF